MKKRRIFSMSASTLLGAVPQLVLTTTPIIILPHNEKLEIQNDKNTCPDHIVRKQYNGSEV